MIERIGVIGGGQLGRMLALDAKRMGFTVITLDPTPHSPCGQVADEQIVAPYEDLDAVTQLGQKSDIVTYEFENIAIESVQHLEKGGFHVTPSSDVLRITQNRLLEKPFMRDIAVDVPEFAAVSSPKDLAGAESAVGYPAIMKTARGGYDGKGQWRVASSADAEIAFEEAAGAELIFERAIPFVKELSIMAARNADGDVRTFPVVENVHDEGILMQTAVPARVSNDVAEKVGQIAVKTAHALKLVGTLCVECFLTEDGTVLVNELAPRPHNSGHYSMDAMPCSQYEQHIRAICGLPLATPHLLSNAVMMNILGDGKGNQLHGIDALLSERDIILHLYGKKHAVARRKMGHFTLLCNDLETGIARAHAALPKLSWR